MKFIYPDGATPLNPDELQGLIPSHITTQAELNEFELKSISEARRWSFSNKRKDIISVNFIKKLHKRMFSLVWKWAGKFRTTNKNLGIEFFKISVELRKLCDDALYWESNKIYPIDELAIIFHHRLVSIHPFPNGNGRHARLMADLILYNNTGKIFSWGSNFMMVESSDIRKRYIKALKAADNNDYDQLFKFANNIDK